MILISMPLGVAWMLAGGVVLSGLLARAGVSGKAMPFFFLPHIVMIPVVVGGIVWQIRSRRRSREELIRANGLLCLSCRYPLEGKLEAGACPECGARYDLFSLKRGWRRTYSDLAYEIDWPARRDQ
jgi:hypothetical protein